MHFIGTLLILNYVFIKYIFKSGFLHNFIRFCIDIEMLSFQLNGRERKINLFLEMLILFRTHKSVILLGYNQFEICLETALWE